MTQPRVVVAEQIAESALAVLRGSCEVDDASDASREELLGRLAEADAIIVRSATKVDADLIGAAPKLRVIGRAGIGVDNIDLAAATTHGVMVVNAPDANTISAAEHTIALLLSQARRIPEADASLRAGRWDRKLFKGVELHGKVLGIVGLGRIGTLVAQRASSFGMRILVNDPYVGEDRVRRLGAELVDLPDLLAQADFITIHLPRNRETEGLIGREAFARMKQGVRLINVARGGIVDEEALAEAVASGKVAGAAIDVFAVEPTTESPLFSLSQLVVTPHLGASTLEAQDKAGLSVAESVLKALQGEMVRSAVNVDLGPDVPVEVQAFLPVAEHLGRIFAMFSGGLPSELTVTVEGELAEHPLRPLAMGALKGALGAVVNGPVTYVNAPILAESHGVSIREASRAQSHDYRVLITLSGIIEGKPRSLSATVLERKGEVLTDVDGYKIELPLSAHMLLIRNDDVPGVIGRVGTAVGDAGLNISDMAVGRHPEGGAMIGIALEVPVDDALVAELRETEGVLAVRAIQLDL